MQLEEYFNFLGENDIRLKDSRIGIETILYEYIYRKNAPEKIQKLYPSLSLEQVYATITYYLHNKEAINQYMADWLQYCLESARKQDLNPSEHIIKLRRLRAKKQSEKNLFNDY